MTHYLYPIDLNLNELLNARLQNVTVGALPAANSDRVGQVVFTTNGGLSSTGAVYWCNGSSWYPIYQPYVVAALGGDVYSITTDGFVYSQAGVIEGEFAGHLTGEADLATSLSDPVTVSITGKATASGVTFQEGGDSVALNVTALSVAAGDITLAENQLLVGNSSGVAQARAKSYITLDQWGAAAGSVDLGTNRIINVVDPVNAQDAATKGWVLGVASGVLPKTPVRLATAAALATYTSNGLPATVLTASANGALTIDSVSPSVNDRILVKDETSTNQKNNGVYVVTATGDGSNPWVLTRATDADTDAEVTTGDEYFVTTGTANGGTRWALQTAEPITLGTTGLLFVQTDGSKAYKAGNGLVQVGTTFLFGQSSAYTANTIPYATDGTTIGFISAPSAHQALRADASGVPGFGQINLASSAAVTGALSAANGGTGQTTYTTGDLLYASGTGTLSVLSKLATVASGSALLSGSVPNWGKIGLSTHVSGTLPTTRGGTGISVDTVPFTTNGVFYASSSSAMALSTGGAIGSILQRNISGVPTFVSMSGDAVLAIGGSLTIASDAVNFAKMQNIATSTVIGRLTAGTGDPESITLSALASALSPLLTPTTITLTGDVTGSGTSSIATTISNLAFTKLQNGSSYSVLGVTGGTGTSVASIQASTTGHCLRFTGSALAFGALDLSVSAATTGVLPTSRGGTGTSTALVFPTVAGQVPRFRKVQLASGSSSYTVAHGYGNAQLIAGLVDANGRVVQTKVDIDATNVVVTFSRATTVAHNLMLVGHNLADA